jgi:hypothetical protein
VPPAGKKSSPYRTRQVGYPYPNCHPYWCPPHPPASLRLPAPAAFTSTWRRHHPPPALRPHPPPFGRHRPAPAHLRSWSLAALHLWSCPTLLGPRRAALPPVPSPAPGCTAPPDNLMASLFHRRPCSVARADPAAHAQPAAVGRASGAPVAWAHAGAVAPALGASAAPCSPCGRGWHACGPCSPCSHGSCFWCARSGGGRTVAVGVTNSSKQC